MPAPSRSRTRKQEQVPRRKRMGAIIAAREARLAVFATLNADEIIDLTGLPSDVDDEPQAQTQTQADVRAVQPQQPEPVTTEVVPTVAPKINVKVAPTPLVYKRTLEQLSNVEYWRVMFGERDNLSGIDGFGWYTDLIRANA